jgi:hypothetical protein
MREQKAAVGITVAEALEEFIPYKRSRGKSKETIRKFSDILKPLIPFAEGRTIQYLSDVDFSTLVTFEGTWKGRVLRDPKTGVKTQLNKSASGMQKYQHTLRMFFRHWHNVGKIPVNPAFMLGGSNQPTP